MAEGRQGDMSQLEMLFSKRNADDGDVEQHAEEHVSEPYPRSTHEKPDDIHHAAQAPMRHFAANARTERPQGEQSQLDALQTERNADDGDHQRHTTHNVFEGDFNTPKHQPNDITQYLHLPVIFISRCKNSQIFPNKAFYGAIFHKTDALYSKKTIVSSKKRTHMNTKRKLMSLAAALLLAQAATAQHEKGQFFIIPRAGCSLATLTSQDIYAMDLSGTDSKSEGKFKPGFVAGADAELMVSNLLGVSVGAFLQMQGCHHTEAGELKAWNTKLDYLNFPVMANLYVGSGFSFKTGVQPGFLVQQSQSGSQFEYENYKTFDFAIPFGVAYDFSNGLTIDARFNIGLTNINKASDVLRKYGIDEKTNNRTFCVTIGYRIPMK
jgi:hypothetical protein